MKKYEVWTEGFRATGQHQTAIYHGFAEAESFDEACIKVLGDSLDKNEDSSYRRMNRGMYSVWACGCFDNEKDARKAFG